MPSMLLNSQQREIARQRPRGQAIKSLRTESEFTETSARPDYTH